MYTVELNKKALKGIEKMPLKVQELMALLIQDLRDMGPKRAEWPNYSTLGPNDYHCHLTRKWVACWRHEKKTILIEVYYAGSREDAPY
jgi:mRNA-degrading endonuclease RelE of RelBE toxin-antitoxin system